MEDSNHLVSSEQSHNQHDEGFKTDSESVSPWFTQEQQQREITMKILEQQQKNRQSIASVSEPLSSNDERYPASLIVTMCGFAFILVLCIALIAYYFYKKKRDKMSATYGTIHADNPRGKPRYAKSLPSKNFQAPSLNAGQDMEKGHTAEEEMPLKKNVSPRPTVPWFTGGAGSATNTDVDARREVGPNVALLSNPEAIWEESDSTQYGTANIPFQQPQYGTANIPWQQPPMPGNTSLQPPPRRHSKSAKTLPVDINSSSTNRYGSMERAMPVDVNHSSNYRYASMEVSRSQPRDCPQVKPLLSRIGKDEDGFEEDDDENRRRGDGNDDPYHSHGRHGDVHGKEFASEMVHMSSLGTLGNMIPSPMQKCGLLVEGGGVVVQLNEDSGIGIQPPSPMVESDIRVAHETGEGTSLQGNLFSSPNVQSGGVGEAEGGSSSSSSNGVIFGGKTGYEEPEQEVEQNKSLGRRNTAKRSGSGKKNKNKQISSSPKASSLLTESLSANNASSSSTGSSSSSSSGITDRN
ncbi:hypothetical protein HDU97_009675 [Phlyctochytrium planicorne]|nr:hypothetical protein HDU97_009675 [Phlyctochytrium planicorne]